MRVLIRGIISDELLVSEVPGIKCTIVLPWTGSNMAGELHSSVIRFQKGLGHIRSLYKQIGGWKDPT